MSAPDEALPLDPTKLVVASQSDPGKVRTENQDASVSLANVSNERLFVVADGMGGQRGGETASKLCLDTLARVFREPHGTPEERLRRGLELANEEVYSHALSKPELKGMGTTAVALLFAPASRGVWLAWVGDSRCYRLRDGALESLSRDHSLMAEWVEMGVISEAEVENHPRRSELTRCIGLSPDVAVEVTRVDVQPGDRFMLSSDGIHAPVQERMLKTVLGGHPPEEAARQLIERANAGGGPDNATAIVIEVPPEAFHEGAVEQLPEVPLELELPPQPAAAPERARVTPPEPEGLDLEKFEMESTFVGEQAPVRAPVAPAPVAAAPERPAPTPAPAVEPPPEPPAEEIPDFGLDMEPTTHSSAAIDAAIAELAAARNAPEPAPSLEDSATSLPQMFETSAESPAPEAAPPEAAPAESLSGDNSYANLSAETSFADLNDEASEPEPEPAAPLEIERNDSPVTPTPAPRRATPPKPTLSPELGRETFGAAPIDSASLTAAPPSRPIRIPLMTPVKKRRGLHAASLLTGLAMGAVVAAVATGAWLYMGKMSQSTTSARAPAPMAQQRSAPRPAPLPQTPRAAPAPAPAPVPEPEVAPEPAPPPPEAVARAVTPPPAPAPAVTPAPAPAVTPTPAQSPAPQRFEPPGSVPPPPTTVVIVRPPGPTPTVTVPAAPDGSAVTPPVPTAAGFELSPAVRRFVDDWLRAQESHDSVLFTSLGFRSLPTELAGTWQTRTGYRLVAAGIDEERSSADTVYLRLVVSYAFTDGSGRFRTEDEERLILRSTNGSFRFEGRWQQ